MMRVFQSELSSSSAKSRLHVLRLQKKKKNNIFSCAADTFVPRGWLLNNVGGTNALSLRSRMWEQHRRELCKCCCTSFIRIWRHSALLTTDTRILGGRFRGRRPLPDAPGSSKKQRNIFPPTQNLSKCGTLEFKEPLLSSSTLPFVVAELLYCLRHFSLY